MFLIKAKLLDKPLTSYQNLSGYRNPLENLTPEYEALKHLAKKTKTWFRVPAIQKMISKIISSTK